jgi:hypothetical protein
MSKNNIPSKNSKSHNEFIEDSWELAGNELLFPKDKLNYTELELIRLKKLLIVSPPPLEHRRVVRKKIRNY